jgi:hypothetical protein
MLVLQSLNLQGRFNLGLRQSAPTAYFDLMTYCEKVLSPLLTFLEIPDTANGHGMQSFQSTSRDSEKQQFHRTHPLASHQKSAYNRKDAPEETKLGMLSLLNF